MKTISKLAISKVKNQNDQENLTPKEELNEDLLSTQELSDVEGGFCDYTCIACSSSGLFSL